MGDCTNESLAIRKQIPDCDFADLFALTPESQQHKIVAKVDRNEIQTVILSDQMLAIIGNEHRAMPIWKRPEHLLQLDVLNVCQLWDSFFSLIDCIITAVAEEGRKGEVRESGAISNDLHAVEEWIGRRHLDCWTRAAVN